MNKQLILLRGLPGAGKSTFSCLFPESLNFEADRYFMDGDEYKFDPTKLADAHKWCQDQVKEAMKSESPIITISNTLTKEWEMKVYYNMANVYGYTVTSLIIENRHGGKNIHGVPEAVLDAMKERFEIKLR